MTWPTFLPAAITLALGMALGRLWLPLHPVWAARLLVTIAVTAALATVGTFGFIAVNYLAGLAPEHVAQLPEWALIGDDTQIPALLGLPAIAFTAAGLIAAGRLAVRWAREIRSARATSVSLAHTDVPVAFAVPGRRGGVMVSRGLMRDLKPAELQVVFHHEGSHLRHRHHRYLGMSGLAAGVLPPLRGLNRRVRFFIERWADEDAAEAVGDRALVAHTIARVALSQRADPPPTPLAGFSDCGVVPRVQALLDTPPDKNTITGPVVLTGASITTGLLTLVALQLDHAVALALF